MSQHNTVDIPQCFTAVVERIEDLFGAPVVVDDVHGEWLRFHVSGCSDRYVILEIEAHSGDILPGSDAQQYQILCGSTRADGPGLWIHSLADSPRGGDYLPGAWFF